MSATGPDAPPASLPRRIVSGLATVAVLLAIFTARVVWGGEAEMRASDAALERGSVSDAVAHARRAASFYAPGAPHVGDAYRRLAAIAVAAEEHHQRDVAIFAWRAVRQSVLDSRWLIEPHREDRAHAEEEVARLSALGVHENAEPDRILEARELALLRHDERPRTGWVVVLVVGAVMTSLGLSYASRAIAASGGRLDFSAGRRSLGVAAVGFVAWLLAWWQA